MLNPAFGLKLIVHSYPAGRKC